MEMLLNSNEIRKLRNQRAWSQNQLAELTGVSLRTIQRIEKDGAASFESAKSLASVFETNIDSLRAPETNFYALLKRRMSWIITAIILTSTFAFIVPASAKSILVDVEVISKADQIARGQLLNEAGKKSEMIIDGLLRIEITAMAENSNNVRLNASLYIMSDGRFDLIATPELVTSNNKTAEIEVKSYHFLFTPHL